MKIQLLLCVVVLLFGCAHVPKPTSEAWKKIERWEIPPDDPYHRDKPWLPPEFKPKVPAERIKLQPLPTEGEENPASPMYYVEKPKLWI